jgi:hypothetical protein
MATIRIDLDASALQALDKRLRLLTDQNLRYMAAKALTGAARAAQQQLRQDTHRYVDRPTRWTLNSTYVRFAKASDLTAEVGFKSDAGGRGNPAARYLLPIVKGTRPQLKGADLSATKLAGVPSGAVLVPSRSSGLINSFGNVSLSNYAKILSGARTKGGQYFIGPVKRGSSTMAVFERKSGFIPRTSTLETSTRRLFTIDPTPKPRRAQFPVRQVLEQGFQAAWPTELRAAYQAELARRLGAR